MGPFPGIPNEIKYICLGIMIAGFGGAFTNNFAVPAMDKLSKEIECYNEEFKGEVKNIISSINTGAFGLGSILGPILASILSSIFEKTTDPTGYRGAYASVLIVVIFTAVMQNYSVYFYKKNKRDVQE